MNVAATQRVVALVDMDCFYCQVETRLNPSLKGKPMAVVQYNQWKGGGIIAVNYEARDRGVSRHMRGDEAKEICPEIILTPVPTIRGKADLSNYRDAGDEVAKVFSEFSDCVQRASIDEAYLDLTKAVTKFIEDNKEELSPDDLPNTFVVGFCDLKNKNEDDRKKGLTQWLNTIENEKTKDSADYHLAVAAKIVEKMRSEIFNKTGFHCSAGIAHNKILAKLTAGLHKPKRQTILPQDFFPELYETLPIYKVRNLGGKLGKQVADKLSIRYMSELYRFSLEDLLKKFDEKTSHWLYNIARGIDLEPVTSRLRPESIGCCKNFTGKNALSTKSDVEHWLKELASEISERLLKDLERNKRRAKLLTVSFCQETSMTRCGALNSYERTRIVSDSLEMLKKFNKASPNEDIWNPPIKFLGLAASKFTEEISSIEKYFQSSKNEEIARKTKEFPSSSKTHNIVDLKNESDKLSEKNTCPKNIKNSKSFKKHNTIKNHSQASFFMKFLKAKKDSPEKVLTESTEDNPIEDDVREEEDKETWISLTEVFPDLNQADEEVVESLPEPIKKKFKERLNSEKASKKLQNNLVPTESNEYNLKENDVKEEENEETWISLTEVFPDLNQADEEVVESLPEPVKKKFKERLNSEKASTEKQNNLIPEIVVEYKTCSECGKEVAVSELPIHSDYHTALKLSTELNKPGSGSVSKKINKNKSKDNEGLKKRKKKTAVTPTKKMKSLTSFFIPLTKQ